MDHPRIPGQHSLLSCKLSLQLGVPNRAELHLIKFMGPPTQGVQDAPFRKNATTSGQKCKYRNCQKNGGSLASHQLTGYNYLPVSHTSLTKHIIGQRSL
ncbi:hypothetical protein TNCV_1661531 [Trichonephila clavipes]|nr:hypothetical protein TNCV_1661531 [Trichonephila clavipes]